MKSVHLASHLVLVRKLAVSAMLAFFLFLACFVPRFNQLDAHWSSDEARWLRRSAVFTDSVQGGRFERTLIAYHPGVMTMWFAGFRTFLLDKLTWRSLKDLVFARWFVGVVVLSGLIATFFLLRRLLVLASNFRMGIFVHQPFLFSAISSCPYRCLSSCLYTLNGVTVLDVLPNTEATPLSDFLRNCVWLGVSF